MPIVRVRGIDLYYEEHGAGPHLVFAHGLMGSVALTPSFGERIEDIAAAGVHVVAYDARGHGRSGYTTRRNDYSWRSLADDMRGLILALGLQPAAVFGGSLGAATALMLALEHPEVVSRLILRAPPPFGDDLKPVRGRFAAIAMLYRSLGSDLTARLITSLPEQRRAQKAQPSLDLRAFFASQRRRSIVPAIEAGLLDEHQLPIHRLSEMAQPALILTHPGDPLHPLASGELLYDRMPHARLAVAPTATYWQEEHAALTHVIASFVRGEPIARGLPDKVLHQHEGNHAQPANAAGSRFADETRIT